MVQIKFDKMKLLDTFQGKDTVQQEFENVNY